MFYCVYKHNMQYGWLVELCKPNLIELVENFHDGAVLLETAIVVKQYLYENTMHAIGT